MPAGSRVRSNNVFGLVSDNPLVAGATALNSTGLVNLAAIGASQHAIITLDPLRVNGAPEYVIVTAHTALASVAVISRGAFGSTARSHPQGTLWTHTPMNEDFISILTSSTRPSDPYTGESIFETDTLAYKAWSGSAWEQELTIGAWTSYTPTLTQSATVAKTINYAKYMKIGRLVVAQGFITVTGAGVASNQIIVGLPLAIATPGGAAQELGTGTVFDFSANQAWKGQAIVQSAASVYFRASGSSTNVLGAIDMTAALAAGDQVSWSVTYEATS